MIYLDNNATTRPAPEVADAMDRAVRECWANPSSVHRAGQVARQQIELARRACAELIGVKPRFITFTGSGTEAIDLAVRGALLARGIGGAARRGTGESAGGAAIVTSRVEHSAVRQLAEALEREQGVTVHWARVDKDSGTVDIDDVARLIESVPGVALVSVQWANNETGAVQPVFEIARLCRARGVLMHCDATQWVGKQPVLGGAAGGGGGGGGGSGGGGADAFDLLTYSPHKFHGPKGVGVLYARAGVPTSPLIHGEQELGRRGGTENVPGIVGAGVAARLAAAWVQDGAERERLGGLRDRFERLVLAGYPEARVNGAVDRPGEPVGTRRLWNTSSIAFPRLEAEALLLLLSERGVCASAGAACSSGSLDPSPVLLAMGVEPELAHGSLRFSLSRETTADEVDEAARVVVQCAERLRGSMRGITPGVGGPAER